MPVIGTLAVAVAAGDGCVLLLTGRGGSNCICGDRSCGTGGCIWVTGDGISFRCGSCLYHCNGWAVEVPSVEVE